ncbi:MAG: hypothetical protein HOH04_05660 [Rhodospirillaceae bacterium]|nr:hypothetical protein [Rhodospirillaceae bacterium]
MSVASVLGGCGPLPKPFKRPDAPPDSLTRATGGHGVRVELPSGTTEPMAKLIAEAVIKELAAREIPANIGLQGKLRYALRGTVTPGVDGSPARIQWQMTEKQGEPFYSFVYDVSGTQWEWEWGSPKIIQRIGEQTAELVAGAVEPEDKTLEPVQAAARGVWVKPIRGAPGDGDISLTRAMRFALMGANVAVTSEPAAARHHLQGEVRVGLPKENAQSVVIRWTVNYPDGGIAGSAVQRNVVPAGTFDGRWGESASIIAAAALGGVKDVLIRAEETVRVRLSGGTPPLRTDIPQEQGKPTLPPPELSPEPELPSPRKP